MAPRLPTTQAELRSLNFCAKPGTGKFHFDIDELMCASTMTVRRSQGSDYLCVEIPLTTSAWLMLQRNPLYTAVTLAKRLVVQVGTRRALAKAVHTEGARRRYTALAERLCRGTQTAARS